MSIPRNEIILGRPIRCYDNGGKTADRYTVIYMDEPEDSRRTYACLGMNHEPFHPQGICQHGIAMVGKHLGKRIWFAELPADCQSSVRADLIP